MNPPPGGWTLLFDADDTLWHNNVHFERATHDFIDFLDHSRLSREEVRAVLDEIELANLHSHGYGSQGFARNLRECYLHLAERHIDEADLATVMQFGERIIHQELDLIEGVRETLEVLARRHRLMIVTKGAFDEQRMKVDASGLAPLFEDVAIVPEKDPAVYRELGERWGFDLATGWMIGNSPRSDINASRAAGMNAVFIPHEQTWSLEHQEISDGVGELLLLERFPDLLAHF